MAAKPERSIQIIKPTLEHADVLSEMGASTFADTFIGMNYYTKEIVDAYNKTAFAIEKIRAELQDPSIRYFLLVVDHQSAGYAKISNKTPPPCVVEEKPIYLDRFYLRKAFHRQGLGTILLNEVYRHAREQKHANIWLSVWEYNIPAVNFYRRDGYKHVGSWEWAYEAAGKKYVDIDWIFTKPIKV